MTLFKDVNGNLSSKRIFGAAAFMVALILTIVALFFDNAGNAKDMLMQWLGFASIALGVTVAERKQ